MDLSAFLLQQFVNAIFLGSIYALIALGYTMVYGIIELINFAHGELFTAGAFIGTLLAGFFLVPIIGLPGSVWIAAALNLAASAFFYFLV